MKNKPPSLRPSDGPPGLMNALLTAILDDDQARLRELLNRDPSLANSPIEQARLYQTKIVHWIYAGDTALHLAAAGYRVDIVVLLLAAGADANSARNHRRGTPLHYAADGYITGPGWDAIKQVKTIHCLLDAGADRNAQDKNGATPLHRAVRTRCAAAVKCLLDAGCNARLRNQPGSTPFHLAVQNTGCGGTGVAAARTAQREIIQVFLSLGLSPWVEDGKGQSVMDCARSSWIRDLLSKDAT